MRLFNVRKQAIRVERMVHDWNNKTEKEWTVSGLNDPRRVLKKHDLMGISINNSLVKSQNFLRPVSWE